MPGKLLDISHHRFSLAMVLSLLVVGSSSASWMYSIAPNQTALSTPDTAAAPLVSSGTVYFPFIQTSPQSQSGVTAAVETDPVTHDTDSADDPLIWIHPTDPALSTIMGNDKNGIYEVYDLTGHRIQSIDIDVANTDIRYNFPLGGERVALVVGFSGTKNGMVAFKVDPVTRKLADVTAPGAKVKSGGGSMYHSNVSGNFYWFSNRDGVFYQYLLSDNGSGQVTSTLVRTVGESTVEAEGIVTDDVLGYVYVAEEYVGLWRYSAEPDGGDTRFQVDKPLSEGGHFAPDLEGLAIYYASDGSGYLFASSQGNSTYTIYQRGGDNQYIGTFKIQDGVVDGTSATDGIDVTNLPLGSAFPYGIFVAQDGANIDNGTKVNQDFKIVPFERIAQVFGLRLDTSWDPRAVGR